MKEFDFTLKFALKNTDQDPEIYIEKLYESGCDDATIGIGKKGRIALDFCREGNNAKEVMLSAIYDVRNVIPGAELIESSPDMVSLSEAAEIIGCSRQNIRQLMLSHDKTAPVPHHAGSKLSVYRLVDILNWLDNDKSTREIDISLKEVAKANKEINTFNVMGLLSLQLTEPDNDNLTSKLLSNSPFELFNKITTTST